mmetsp:Transcript_18837/g.17990  ORF Transcript_18837/g.17990 Transcript_18837/m.17990 type:complete len:621 (+) Transcript_18837:371-2233(+)
MEELSPIKESEMDQLEVRIVDLENQRGISAFGKDLPTEEQEKLDRKMHLKANLKDEDLEKECLSAIQQVSRSQGVLTRLLQYSFPKINIYVGLISSALFGSLLPLASILLSKIVFVLEGYYGYDTMAHQGYMICLYLAIFAFAAFFTALAQKHTFGKIGENITLALRRVLYRSILTKEVGWFDHPQYSPGVLSNVMAKEAIKVKGAAAEGVAIQVEAGFALATAAIICVVYQWQMGLICLVIIPLMFLSSALTAKFQVGMDKEQSELLKKPNQLSADVITNYRTVAALANEYQIVSDYQKLLAQPLHKAIKETFLMGFLFGLSKFIQYAAYAFIYCCCAFILGTPDPDPVGLYTTQLVANQGAQSAGNATIYAPDIGAAKQAAVNIFTIIDRPSAINPLYQVNKKPLPKNEVRGEIVFKNVWFRYPTRTSDWVLRNLNLTIRQNETAALVGESGCGKSTIVSLLLRFNDINFGSITLDGIDIRDIEVTHLRAAFGLVMQEPALFNYSIYENILYGNAEALNSEILEASHKANAMEFIERFADENQLESIEETFESLRKEFEANSNEIIKKIGMPSFNEILNDLILYEKEEAKKGKFVSVTGSIDKRDSTHRDVDLDIGFF